MPPTAKKANVLLTRSTSAKQAQHYSTTHILKHAESILCYAIGLDKFTMPLACIGEKKTPAPRGGGTT